MNPALTRSGSCTMPLLSILGAVALTAGGAQAGAADLVIENARIWSDGRAGFAAFAAVDEGRFVYVGAFDPGFLGPSTERIDAGGRVVIPGLIDSHIHMLSGGRGLSRLQLREAGDKREFIARIAAWTTGLEADQWVLGGRWSTESWSEQLQPTKDWVDGITKEHPLFLSRMDGHSALVNSVALDRAGITREGPANPVGGVIDRDPVTHEPTGILRESAMSLVARLIPESLPEDDLKALRRAIRHALAQGITAVCDIPGAGDLTVYEALADSDLPLRFFLYLSAPDWETALETGQRFRGKPGWLEINGFKAYLDGSLGSRTAMMREPFLNNPPDQAEWRGLWAEGVENGQFARNIQLARQFGFQPITHAIGDEANHFLLDTLEAHFTQLADTRCRSEHAQHLLPADIQRFGELGVIASMQPYHKADDGRYAESSIGIERCHSSYAYRSLLNAGAVVAFGSDWPVVTLNPFLGMEAAVTGRTLDGKLWETQENITVADALRSYTSHAAYAAFAEDELGRIAPGYRADFVILNTSPFQPGVDWGKIKPWAVFVEGRPVAGEGVTQDNSRNQR